MIIYHSHRRNNHSETCHMCILTQILLTETTLVCAVINEIYDPSCLSVNNSENTYTHFFFVLMSSSCVGFCQIYHHHRSIVYTCISGTQELYTCFCCIILPWLYYQFSTDMHRILTYVVQDYFSSIGTIIPRLGKMIDQCHSTTKRESCA